MDKARFRRRRDAVVAVAGALAVLAAALALATVESRPGHEAQLRPLGVAVEARGDLSSRPGQGTVLPGGACVPQPPATQCVPPRTEVSWRLEGLPPVSQGVAYAAFLRTDDGHVPLGALVREDGAHVLEHASEDHHDATQLVLGLGQDPLSFQGTVVLHEASLDRLDDGFWAAPAGSGSVRVDQIGAASVSLLASAELEAPPAPGLVHRVWLEDDGLRPLGEVAFEDGRGTLDVRLERVRVPEQGRVLVTLGGPDHDVSQGFPAYQALLGS